MFSSVGPKVAQTPGPNSLEGPQNSDSDGHGIIPLPIDSDLPSAARRIAELIADGRHDEARALALRLAGVLRLRLGHG